MFKKTNITGCPIYTLMFNGLTSTWVLKNKLNQFPLKLFRCFLHTWTFIVYIQTKVKELLRPSIVWRSRVAVTTWSMTSQRSVASRLRSSPWADRVNTEVNAEAILFNESFKRGKCNKTQKNGRTINLC